MAIGFAACGGDSKEDKLVKEGVAVMEQVKKAAESGDQEAYEAAMVKAVEFAKENSDVKLSDKQKAETRKAYQEAKAAAEAAGFRFDF